jgi:hypothetical protein
MGLDTLYCGRGKAENLIKLHMTQLASDRTSCRSAIGDQIRLVLHTAAYWLMPTVSDAIPKPRDREVGKATARYGVLSKPPMGDNVTRNALWDAIYPKNWPPGRKVWARSIDGICFEADRLKEGDKYDVVTEIAFGFVQSPDLTSRAPSMKNFAADRRMHDREREHETSRALVSIEPHGCR